MNRIFNSNFIRVARVSAGLAQWEVARQIGRSCAFVSRMENGVPVPLTPDLVEKIAQTLNLPVTLVVAAAHPTSLIERLGKTPLRAAIRAAGTTQRSVARKVGVEQWVMSEIVIGRSAPTPELAMKISKVVGVPVRKLFDFFEDDGDTA